MNFLTYPAVAALMTENVLVEDLSVAFTCEYVLENYIYGVCRLRATSRENGALITVNDVILTGSFWKRTESENHF